MKLTLDDADTKLLNTLAKAAFRTPTAQMRFMLRNWSDPSNASSTQRADLTPVRTDKKKSAFCWGGGFTNPNGFDDYVILKDIPTPDNLQNLVPHQIEGWQHEDDEPDGHIIPARLVPDYGTSVPDGVSSLRRFDSEQELFDFAVECRRKGVSPRPVVNYTREFTNA